MIPKHVAIIMDGNGRWANNRSHPRFFGHVRGSKRIVPIVRYAQSIGIKTLSLYAFSTENWKRKKEEISVLWKILKRFLNENTEELSRNNVRLRVLGEIYRFESDIRKSLESLIKSLSNNTGLNLNLCISYGSRSEIVNAARLFALDCVFKKKNPKSLNENIFERYLYSSELKEYSNVDLVIRTGGEKRTSNFLLWQAAYAEYVFFDCYWPEFLPSHFKKAVDDFKKRNRRFGK